MGRIAHIQLDCPNCGKTTDAYIRESPAERVNARCQHCKRVFEFGPGIAYKPIAYVPSMPDWAEVDDDETVAQTGPAKKWWEFWK